MLLSQDTSNGKNIIRSYEVGAIMVNNDTYSQSIIISPMELISNWQPQRLTELTAEHLELILQYKPEVVLLGVGERLQFPPAALLASLINKQIGVEVMDTRAACHTYNVLVAEDRRVVAALLIR